MVIYSEDSGRSLFKMSNVSKAKKDVLITTPVKEILPDDYQSALLLGLWCKVKDIDQDRTWDQIGYDTDDDNKIDIWIPIR